MYPKYFKQWPYTVTSTIDGLFLSLLKLKPCHIHWIVCVLAGNLLAGNALGISICGCRCILERSWSQNSGCASTRSLKISGCKRWCHKDLRVLAPAAPALTHSLVHTVSSQDFRSFHFLSFFMAKTVLLKFFVKSQRSLLHFCHLTNSLQRYWFFMTLNPIFS